MNAERWTLYLAEVDSEPEPTFHEALPGAERLTGRIWLYPGHPAPGQEKRPVPFSTHPVYGKTYARPIAMGEGLEELRAHPAVQEHLQALARAYASYLAMGSLVRAEEVAERLRAFGAEELVRQGAEEAEPLQRQLALLKASGAPVGIREGKVVVGNPPAFALESPEEAELVAKTYAWAARERVRLVPLPRDGQGRIRFAADVFAVAYEGGDEIRIPLVRRPRQASKSVVVKLVRRTNGVAAEAVRGFPPPQVVLFFLPHNND